MTSTPGAGNPPPDLRVSLSDIRAAADFIAGDVVRTPMRYAQTLSRITGSDLFLKFENLQFTASFKERGALNRLLSLTPRECRQGIVAMSAGNHAQAVAYHAGRLGIPATIVMPVGTPFTKVKHTQDFGAKVILEGDGLSEAFVAAHKLEVDQGLILVHPYDDPLIIAGQGTIGLEMIANTPDLDVIVVPVGGGGLIAGIAVAAKALSPKIEIVGVQTKAFPSMQECVFGGAEAGQDKTAKPKRPATIAEGIAVKYPGQITRAIIGQLVSDIVLIEEFQIESAIHAMAEIEKTVVEGAGAAALAAVMTNPERFKGRKVGLVLSGGNIDMRLLSNVILRELSREGRILSLTIEIEDIPGSLARIASIVSGAGGNILDVSHNRMLTDRCAKSADLGVIIEARDAVHAQAIRGVLSEAGFSFRAHRGTSAALQNEWSDLAHE